MKKGDNTKDFEVTPYIRVKNPKIAPSQTYTLTIDVAANQSAFKYAGKNYFL